MNILPKISAPEYRCVLPSNKQEIMFRPFLVKEQKILHMAIESGEESEITNAMINIIQDCISTHDIHVKKMPSFDVEYLFLQLRSKSVGEVITFNAVHNDEKCGGSTKVEILIDTLEVDMSKTIEPKIMITDDVGVTLKYPNMEDSLDLTGKEIDKIFGLISKCLVNIYDKEKIYEDISLQDKKEWIETLNQSQFQKIMSFFEGIPALSHKIEWVCGECKEEQSLEIRGAQSFFM
jgi:hypothetical protein